MNELSNTLEDLLTEQQLKEYLSKEYPFNTNFLGQILKEKLKQDPDYEVWVPFFYCKYILRRKDRNSPSVVHSPLTFISNKGGLVRLRKGVYIPIPSKVFEAGYFQCMVGVSFYKQLSCMLHRAIASVFIPLPPELKLRHPKDLQVNHIDGVKTNFELSNLEWSTDSANIRHAVKAGLIKSGKDSVLAKPVKGKVEFGPYEGHEFVLYGPSDCKKYGFTKCAIVACCKGRRRIHRNCFWSYATDEDVNTLPHGISTEIKDSFNLRS